MTNAKKKVHVQPTVELETITPGEARQILEGNPENNRNLNMALVKLYQRQLENNKWQVNGESIKVDTKGYLLDGQHRLHAIVLANKPMTTYVARNLDRESFKTIDCGKTRSPSDFLKMEGFGATGVNLNVVAAAARIVMNFDKKTGRYFSRTEKLSPTELIGFVDNHSGLIESAKRGQAMQKIMSVSVAAGCHYIFSVVDPEKTHAFFEALHTGAGLSKGNPALTLRNRLMTLRTQKQAGSAYQKMIVAYMVQAFNDFRVNKKRENCVYLQESDIVLDEFAGAMR